MPRIVPEEVYNVLRGMRLFDDWIEGKGHRGSEMCVNLYSQMSPRVCGELYQDCILIVKSSDPEFNSC